MTDTRPNFDLVLFGATGDLAMRKLLPALCRAHAAGSLHPQGRILATGRSRLSRADFIERVKNESLPRLDVEEACPDTRADFLNRIDYLSADIGAEHGLDELAAAIRSKTGTQSLVFYLATASKFFAPVCRALARAGLNGGNARVVLEKPLGSDLASCRRINDDIAQYFRENQICRIDHYLGKESLQNLPVLRFGNAIFEPLWNKEHIRSVQITVGETLGVEERGEFYDTVGALRDMVQNHIMQMLCYTAMERPASLSPEHVRDAKLRLIRALKPINPTRDTVRGQYTASDGLKAYTEEHKVPPHSRTETYAALRCEIDNPRWQGVPFYLRTGKRLAERTAEIVIDFKPVSDGLYPAAPDRIVITLQPHETLRLNFAVKAGGQTDTPATADLVFDTARAAGGRRTTAYQLLLTEAIAGRQTLFNRRDELEAAWEWLDPVLAHWAQDPAPPHPYPAGSRGPAAADRLPAADGNRWFEER